MSHRAPITIIGAGIAGLTLARCLRHRGISATIYERDSLRQATSRHNYGITLKRLAYQPLFDMLGIDEQTFRRRLAVDSELGGDGYVSRKRDPDYLRANRQRLEALLREGLDIKYEHKITDLRLHDSSNEATLIFSNGEQTLSTQVIAADGPHSLIRRTISPASEFNIRPFVVFNGKRRLSRSAFDADFAPYMAVAQANVLEHKTVQGTLLQISLNDVDAEKASLSYTFSRSDTPNGDDSLFTPDRPNSGATTIPDQLFDEIAALTELSVPFSTVFAAEAMREDRLLSWLMRSAVVPESDLEGAAAKGVVLIADAAHHAPILGSWGACEAMLDAVELAECIAEGGDQGLQDFIRTVGERWAKYVGDGEIKLEAMHETLTASARL